MKIDLELFEELEEEEKIEELPENVTINGDVIINITKIDKDGVQKNARQKRMKITSPWKNKIKKRDKNVCQCCKQTFESHLEVHHIFPFSKYPSLAIDDGNAISLCQRCHKKYHTLFEGRENPSTFAKFLRDYGER